MKLIQVRIARFRNFVDEQSIDIEKDVTCFVGKNESGKTTILQALHRLNPAKGSAPEFDLTVEYPRWRLSRDRRAEALGAFAPISADFELSADDIECLCASLGSRPPATTICRATRDYDNVLRVTLRCDLTAVVRLAGSEVGVDPADLEILAQCQTADEVIKVAKERVKELKDAGELARSKVLTQFQPSIESFGYLTGHDLVPESAQAVAERLPTFFYFSNYDILPGECDLNVLAEQVASGTVSEASYRTVLGLLTCAGEAPADFLDEKYESRKAELQAAALDLSRKVFEYWRQNSDLSVSLDTDMVVVSQNPSGEAVRHRFLKVELRDDRHGGVETNFSTRSAGFQWFFSFFAAFTEYQDSGEPIIVLLDEPGTSLHGEAQRDFVRFIFEELGVSKQVLYTTHSQHMVDPTHYEKIRAVHDRATRSNPDLGVAVTPVDLAADRETVLPVEAALGYSISQHLFLGTGQHLVVEGGSDFVYIQRMTEFLVSEGRTGLDPRLAVIPVGGADNVPSFVALLGRRMKVSVLVDGDRTGGRIDRILAAARANGVPDSVIVVCSDIAGLPRNADIEDLFSADDYLRLYRGAVGPIEITELPVTGEPILRRIQSVKGKFDHALPAHFLTHHRDEFFRTVEPSTVGRFEQLFLALNETLA